MKSLFGGTTALAVLVTATAIFYANPLTTPAETALSKDTTAAVLAPASQQAQQRSTNPALPEIARSVEPSDVAGTPPSVYVLTATNTMDDHAAELPPMMSARSSITTNTAGAREAQSFVATAYSLMGRTASGRRVSKGIIAADPNLLPLGTRVRLEAGAYSGEYVVADTGGAVRGRKIDVWVPTSSEACRFGRRKIKLTILSYGARRRR